MKETLDMKVTISAVATPELYRTMISVTNPRQRAALLKRLADDCLKGVVSTTRDRPTSQGASLSANPQSPGESPFAPHTAQQSVENKLAPSATTKSNPMTAIAEDDDHYDFLENNLTGFG